MVESHPADYTPEATAVYEAVISAAKDVFLNEAATLEEVKNVMTTISGPLNTYLMSVIEASEENPVDVTFLIKNPDFNANNANSWTGATGSAKETVYEFFNKAFNMYQKLAGLPAGYYQLKVQGLARVGIPDAGAAYKAGTEKVQSFLYGKSKAGEWNTPLMSLYAEQGTGSKDGYANSMAEANTAFKNGKYLNNVVDNIFLQESDTLTMGTKYEVNPVVKDSWTIFDNFQLIYKGNTLGTLVKELEALIQDAKAVTGVMQIAVTDALNAKITAAEAIVATEEPTKEELDGAIADLNNAIAAAESSIAAYVKLNNAIVVAGESSVAAEANVVAAIAIAQGVYDAKTVDEKGIQDALAALNGAVNATIVAKAVDGDVTALIKNPNIIQTATSVQTRPAGWENSTNSGTNGNFTKAAASATTPEVDTYLEAWNATASTINFDYNQILANVPNGIYVLSAATFTEDKSGNAVLYGNKVTAPMKTGVTGDNFFDVNNPAVNTTLTVVVTNDTLQIGIKTIGTLNGSWNGADYFKLTYLGDKATLQQELSDSIAIAGELKDGATKAMIVKAEMNKLVAAIDGGNAALVADDLSKMSDALTVLRTAITDARTSIGHCTELAALFVEANTLIATYGQTLDPTALQTVLDKNMNMYMNQTDQTDNAALVTAKAEMKAAIDAYKKIIIDDVKTVDADSVKVYVDGSSIIVEGADNYEIYTEGGLLVPANAELVPGIYIVKVAGQTIKIQVK